MPVATLAPGTPQQFTLFPGEPVSFTGTGTAATVQMGYTSAQTANGPTVVNVPASGVATWAWPGIYINYGSSVLWLEAVTANVTINYLV
jgi:hypothetical protein